MPKISIKGEQMPESPIRKLIPFSDQAKRRGTVVYHLNIGQPDIPTPKVALDAIRNFDKEIIDYSHSAGIIELREKLLKYYLKINKDLSLRDIMITTGGSEAIMFILSTIADKGEEIIIPEPFYANYIAFSISSGVEPIPVPSSIENNFRLPSPEEIEEKITDKTRAILICNPGNPTGTVYTKQEILTLKNIALKYDLFIIADEVYRELIYENEHYSLLEFDDLVENAIVIDSFSKRYSMCGARIGCIVSRNKEVMKTTLKFAQARLCAPVIEQYASAAVMDLQEDYFFEIKNIYKKRRDVLVESLNKIEGVYCPNPEGAFYCMVKLPIQDSEHFAKWMLESFDFEGETVMLAPGSGFYTNEEMGKDEVRIGYVLEESKLKRCAEIIQEALKVYPYKK